MDDFTTGRERRDEKMTDPYDDNVFKQSLMRIAGNEDKSERERAAKVLAMELALAFNKQGNNAQRVISEVEGTTTNKFDTVDDQLQDIRRIVGDMRQEDREDRQQLRAGLAEMHEHVQEGHLLISTFCSSFPTQFAVFQEEMRSAVEEVARGLGKLSKETDQRFRESVEDRAALHAELSQVKSDVQAIKAYLDPEMTPERAREQTAHYIEMLNRHEAIFAWMVQRWPEIRDMVNGDGT